MVSTDINGGKIDFNKDGFADIIQIGHMTESIGYSSTTGVLIANDRNGFFKVALGSPTGITFLTTGSTANGPKVATDGIAQQIAVVDLDGDGYQDILAITSASSGNLGSITRRYTYDPIANKFSTPQIGDPVATNSPHLSGNSGHMTLGDVNSDSIPDLVFPRYDINNPVTNPNPSQTSQIIPLVGFDVYLGKQETNGSWIGNFQATPYASINLQSFSADLGMAFNTTTNLIEDTISSRSPYVAAILADLNGDGKLDIAAPENNGVSVFANPGNGLFSGSGVFIQSAGVNANGLNLAAADFNNDGKMDLATSPNIPSINLWDSSTRFSRP